jgi:hypothetical protein
MLKSWQRQGNRLQRVESQFLGIMGVAVNNPPDEASVACSSQGASKALFTGDLKRNISDTVNVPSTADLDDHREVVEGEFLDAPAPDASSIMTNNVVSDKSSLRDESAWHESESSSSEEFHEAASGESHDECRR